MQTVRLSLGSQRDLATSEKVRRELEKNIYGSDASHNLDLFDGSQDFTRIVLGTALLTERMLYALLFNFNTGQNERCIMKINFHETRF